MSTFRNIRALVRTMQKTRWVINNDHEIRHIEHVHGILTQFCPLTFVAYTINHKFIPMSDFHHAAELLGFTKELSSSVARSADHVEFWRIRDILERAVKLANK